MQYKKFEGIIINRRFVGDADRFYTIFTKEDGKIMVFARSVRNIKSKRASSLDLFSKIKFESIEKNDRKILTHVDLIESNREGKTKIINIARLFEIGELVDALTGEEDPHVEVYQLLDTALVNISRFVTPEYLYRFKTRLLKELGFYSPSLTDSTIDSYIESLIERPLRSPQMTA
ncbi:MAG: replication and repair protein RecO protein [Microgenomates group bacterium GW2011_GWF2_47_9]|nr:MAG: replication and repair protein RecO protein [Microgenomates group bacterium GW2011_GWF2_47_9]